MSHNTRYSIYQEVNLNKAIDKTLDIVLQYRIDDEIGNKLKALYKEKICEELRIDVWGVPDGC